MADMIMKRPSNLKELIFCLAEANESTYLLGGGTDFIVKGRKNKLYSGTIIDLKNLNDLNFIKNEDCYIKIGAITTFSYP